MYSSWINWILSLGEDIGSTWEAYFWLPAQICKTPEHHEEESTTNSIEKLRGSMQQRKHTSYEMLRAYDREHIEI